MGFIKRKMRRPSIGARVSLDTLGDVTGTIVGTCTYNSDLNWPFGNELIRGWVVELEKGARGYVLRDSDGHQGDYIRLVIVAEVYEFGD